MFNDVLLFKPPTEILLGQEFELIMCEHSYLSEQRKAMGMSQNEVARAANIHLRQYQRLESGERSMSSTSLRIGLSVCDVLKLDPHRFAGILPIPTNVNETSL